MTLAYLILAALVLFVALLVIVARNRRRKFIAAWERAGREGGR